MIIGVNNQDLLFRNVKSRDSFSVSIGFQRVPEGTFIDDVVRIFFLKGTFLCEVGLLVLYLAVFINRAGTYIFVFS